MGGYLAGIFESKNVLIPQRRGWTSMLRYEITNAAINTLERLEKV